MTEHELPVEFDDELLSAYLDDELTPAQRALVENRLATDPSARQLLDQLRAVSQAMKELPSPVLDDSLRDTVLRRAERALLEPAANASAENLGGVGSFAERAKRGMRFSIGRTRRGWLWAGAAVAAALAIMVLQSDPDKDNRVPREVALRSGERPAAPVGGAELRAAREPREEGTEIAATPAAPTRPSGGSGGTSAVGDREDSWRGGAPSGRDELAAGRASAVESDGQLTPHAESAATVAAGAADPIDRASLADDFEAEDVDLLVVHLNVTPVALERNAIDEVLFRNGIFVEEPAPDMHSDIGPESDLALGTQLRRSKERRMEEGRASGQPQVDVVFVEAPPAQIVSCLAEMDADRSNYLGIAVDDELTASKRAAGKSPSVDWKQYGRGSVPQQQKVQLAPGNKLHYQLGREAISLDRSDSVGGDAVQRLSRSNVQSDSSHRGRAMRVQSQLQPEDFAGGGRATEKSQADTRSNAKQPVGAFDAQSYNAPQQDAPHRQIKKLAAKDSDTLQVLFVLSADDDAAPSPPADDRLP